MPPWLRLADNSMSSAIPYELFLAFRYLRSQRKRRLARVTALVAMLGIALGVGALIVALALANGFRDEMRDKILRGTAHLSVMRVDGQPLENHRELAARLKQMGKISDAAGTTYQAAVLVGPQKTAYAVLRGLDNQSPKAVADLDSELLEGSTRALFNRQDGEPPAVIIGAELARLTGLRPGEVGDLIVTDAHIESPSPVRRLVLVGGIFRSGLFEYDSSWVYLSLDTASALAGTKGSATVLSAQVKDIYDVKAAAAKVRANLGDSYTVLDWQEANRPLFTALALERRMGLFIIALIILIAALNITTMVILVVVERRRDIAILSSMGATSRSITSIFLLEGATIGLVGALLGVLGGTLACLLGNHYKLVSLPADVYSIGNVPFNAHPRDMLLAAVVAFVLSLLATVYPARAAARVRPAEMLRET